MSYKNDKLLTYDMYQSNYERTLYYLELCRAHSVMLRSYFYLDIDKLFQLNNYVDMYR